MKQNELIFCACGCGKQVWKYHKIAGYERKYIRGHWMKVFTNAGNFKKGDKGYWTNKYFTKEHKDNLSKALTGRKLAKDHIKNIGEASKINWKVPGYAEKRMKSFLETSKKSEVKEKHSESMKNVWKKARYKEKTIARMREVCRSPEIRKKRSISSTNLWKDLELRKKHADILKKSWEDPELRKRQSLISQKTQNRPEVKEKHILNMKRLFQDPLFKKKHHDAMSMPETKQKLSIKQKANWENPIYRENQIKSSLKGLMIRPSSYEKKIIDIIKKYNLPYRYTGDGTFLIAHKNPDFINTNGEKICIEVFNDFHHPKNYKKLRSKYFNKYGWKTIFIGQNELNEEIILRKLTKK